MKKLSWFLLPIASWIITGFAFDKAAINFYGNWGFWWVLTCIVLVFTTIALVILAVTKQGLDI